MGWQTWASWGSNTALSALTAAGILLPHQPPPRSVPASYDQPVATAMIDSENSLFVTATATAARTATFRFEVDTGASDVAFRRQDAARLGLNPSRLAYDMRFDTSNGVSRAASLRLRKLVIGSCVLHDVDASIDSGNAFDAPLLGMSALRRMKVTIENGALALYCG